MKYEVKLSLLSSEFTRDYPPADYPELMHKHGRPYTCLLIDMHNDYYICVPFRSSIGHKNAYMFTETERSKKTGSGLDYSKIVLIKNENYFDFTKKAVVDQDEYAEMMKNLSRIIREVIDYVDTYINHIKKTRLMHPREFMRKYQYSTLAYFHDIMGI